MHLNLLPPTMLLIAAAMSTPVPLPAAAAAANHLLHPRQLGTLAPLLKGIMDQNSGSPSPAAPAEAVPPAGTTPVPTQVSYHEDCASTIQKIDVALNTSERYMGASGEKPTISDVQVVLAVLADLLGDDCMERNPLGSISMSGSPMTTATAIALEARDSTKCSDCERQLYGIVKGLQQILAMTQQGMGETEVSSVVGSALSMSMTITANMVSTSMMVAVTTPTAVGMGVTGRA